MMPLEGIRVVSLERGQQLPYASVMLADFGAEVIRVEPKGGETQRGMHRVKGRYITDEEFDSLGLPAKLKLNTYLMAHARNKKGIALDLNHPRGKEIVYRLAESANAFMQNSRLSWVKKSGFDYETIKKYNPKIVYVNVSGFGDTGPMADYPAYDTVGQALGGITNLIGFPDQGPVTGGAAIGDQVGGMVAAYGTVVALMAQQRFGIGQEVTSSMLGAQLALQSFELDTFLLHDEMPRKAERGHCIVNKATFQMYCCQDGKWIAVAGVMDNRWRAFCRVLGMEEYADKPGWANGLEREQRQDELKAMLEERFATRPRDEWTRTLREADITFAPVSEYRDLICDTEVGQQIRENDYITNLDVPGVGTVQVVGIPVKLKETPGQVRSRYPELGEHTNEVLLDLGYTWEEIAELVQEEVI